MLKINFSRHSEKFIRTIPAKHARQIGAKIMALREMPNPPDSISMKGKAADYRRVDSGEYRIIHRVNADTLEIVLIGKRNDDEVYKRFLRIL
jgi:mRNA interferase RelE/StbE